MPDQPSRRNAMSPRNAQVLRAFSAQIYPLNSTTSRYFLIVVFRDINRMVHKNARFSNELRLGFVNPCVGNVRIDIPCDGVHDALALAVALILATG
jgi:hypothetical protein